MEAGQGEGSEPGRGGTGRGRGDAPLAFEMEERPRLDTVSRRAVHEDLSRAALGEAAGVESAAPSRKGLEMDWNTAAGGGVRPAVEMPCGLIALLLRNSQPEGNFQID